MTNKYVSMTSTDITYRNTFIGTENYQYGTKNVHDTIIVWFSAENIYTFGTKTCNAVTGRSYKLPSHDNDKLYLSVSLNRLHLRHKTMQQVHYFVGADAVLGSMLCVGAEKRQVDLSRQHV